MGLEAVFLMLILPPLWISEALRPRFTALPANDGDDRAIVEEAIFLVCLWKHYLKQQSTIKCCVIVFQE
ncbi:hypothetical protein PJM26_30785, partial [Mycobacterium kansasii]